MSGRTLRKIPFLAHSNFMASTTPDLTITAFLQALEMSVKTEVKEAEALRQNSS